MANRKRTQTCESPIRNNPGEGESGALLVIMEFKVKGFKVSRFQGFKVSRFQSFQGFRNSAVPQVRAALWR
jgi:hypothetical protein